MKVAIIGAGFTGLAAAHKFLQKNHQVTLYEQSPFAGGLAASIKHSLPEEDIPWEWDLEQFYHHWFTNDDDVYNFAKDIGVENKFITTTPTSSVLYQDKTYQFDSPLSLLKVPFLSPVEKFKLGKNLAELKYLLNESSSQKLESTTAHEYLTQQLGQKAYQKIWEPLLVGKFADHYKEVNARWFWARVFKRTQSLRYYKGGFGAFITDITNTLTKDGATIHLETPVLNVSRSETSFTIQTREKKEEFDIVLATTPPPLLAKLVPELPDDYKGRLKTADGLGALVMVLSLHHPLMQDTYWLNINDTSWPFLACVEHTNFMDKKHYNDEHLIYIGDYLDKNHPYMSKTKEELLHIYTPYIKKINPLFSDESIIRSMMFRVPYAQPIVKVNHEEKLLPIETPINGLFLATMAQVYPWDRGTNYAVEIGNRAVDLILK